MRTLRPILTLGVLALVAGCAGGTQSAAPPLAGNPAHGAAGGASSTQLSVAPDAGGTLVYQISRPSRGKSYVSPASQGLSMAFTGPRTFTRAFRLGASAPGCAKGTHGIVCTITIALGAGNYTTTLDVYDRAPVRGQIPPSANLLSEAPNVRFTITSGNTTTIAPRLQGIPASLSVGSFPSTCTAFPPTPFTVTAYDAYNYTIVGGYGVAITLSDGDTSGATTVATSGKDNPPPLTLISSFDTATLAWNGSPIPGGSATIGAQAGSARVYASGVFTPQTPPKGYQNFYETGSFQYFIVPNCATTVFVIAYGAQGGHDFTNDGGMGGAATGTIPTTPGETLVVVVGGAGFGDTVPPPNGGYNGGADGAGYCPPSIGYCHAGAGGGGASDVRQGGSGLGNRVVVAGGGGGAGFDSNAGGGPGGGLTGGGGGNPGSCRPGWPASNPGGGGTQTSGGTGGGDPYYTNDGSFGSGGPGEFYCANNEAGGGGGGWYGGGGGFVTAGGGGGSAYVEPSATNVQFGTGLQSGNGIVSICWGGQGGLCPTDVRLRSGRTTKLPRH